MPVLPFRLSLRTAGLCLALVTGQLCAAPAPAFTASLPPATAEALGLTRLSDAETTTLDTLVARDVAAARQGGVTAFRGTFSSRRTPTERTTAGLDKLSAAELAQLDERVATAIATRPLLVTKPAPPADPGGIDVSDALKPEIHGRVTLGYAWSKDGNYRYGSVESYYYDPASRVTIGLGVSTGRGSGSSCFRY